MAGVTAYPIPMNRVRREGGIQRLPEIDIGERAAFPAPAAPAPTGQPLRDAALQIFRIGIEFDPARLVESLESLDCGGKLHSVVGGVLIGACDRFFAPAELEQRGPAARAGIGIAGAVGVNVDEGESGECQAAGVRCCHWPEDSP